jgi:hypothetical protein
LPASRTATRPPGAPPPLPRPARPHPAAGCTSSPPLAPCRPLTPPARAPATRRGSRKTLGNFVKATFAALASTYGFLTPDLWAETRFTKAPLQEFTDLLAKPQIGFKPAAAADF